VKPCSTPTPPTLPSPLLSGRKGAKDVGSSVSIDRGQLSLSILPFASSNEEQKTSLCSVSVQRATMAALPSSSDRLDLA
jgi:hypothetical protein